MYLVSLLAIVTGISYAINNIFGPKIYMFKSFRESMMITVATLFGYMDGVSSLVSENDILLIFIIGAILLGLATMFINVFIIMAKYAYKESFRVVSTENEDQKAFLDNKEELYTRRKEKKVYKYEEHSESVNSEEEFTTEELINSNESEPEQKKFEFSSYQNVLKRRKRLKKLRKRQKQENDGDLFNYTPHWSIRFKEFFKNLRRNSNKKNCLLFLRKIKNHLISFFIEKKSRLSSEDDSIAKALDSAKQPLFRRNTNLHGSARAKPRRRRGPRHHQREHQLQPDSLPEEAPEVRHQVQGHPQTDPLL